MAWEFTSAAMNITGKIVFWGVTEAKSNRFTSVLDVDEILGSKFFSTPESLLKSIIEPLRIYGCEFNDQS